MEKNQLSFYTNKNDFKKADLIAKAKDVLFNFCDNSYIESILAENGIDIKKEQIIARYKETYDLYNLVDEFCEKYDEQLDSLEDKFYLLDGDCLVYYINKVVKEVVDPFKCPDPFFLPECLEDFRSRAVFFEAKAFSDYLDTINKVKDYHGRNWEIICDKADEDVVECLTDCVVTFLADLEMSNATARKLIKQLKQFLDNNDTYDNFIICNGMIMVAYNLPEKELRVELEEGCKRYPQYALYFTANLGMSLYNKEIYLDYAKELIEKSQKMIPQSPDDEDFQGHAREYLKKDGSKTRLLS